MKIKCEYCGSMFDDTLEKCPSCGAPNQNVRRSTADQPTTIEGLKEWYESKGLPPYETTRFFIGIDYKYPRAFGIYKDENTGNFIVYKNKDNGQRAVRYEGSDEAYAVNELFMRLKQEIIEQKSRNASAQRNTDTSPADAQKYYDSYHARRSSGGRSNPGGRKALRTALTIIGIYLAVQIFGPTALFGLILGEGRGVPEKGYYSYNGNTYYSFGDYSYVDDSDRWAVYNTASGEWETADVSAIPEFKKNRKAKDYYLSRDYPNDYDFPTISDTRLYYDNSYKPGYVTTGYYSYDDNEYYRMDSYDTSSWYVYSDEYDDWRSVSSSDVPEALTNQYDAKDFYYVPNWNSDTQITDFKDTEYYAQYERDQEAERQSSYSSSDDSWSSNDSSDYSWSSSDSWDSGSSDWSSDW